MARTATVKIGNAEAVYDGEKFTSEDESTMIVLNSALYYYLGGGHLQEGNQPYWPDPFADLARAIAEYCGGELVSVDPPEGPEAPEGAVY